jgi:hypothetical protein
MKNQLMIVLPAVMAFIPMGAGAGVVAGDSLPGGIGYRWTVTMSGEEVLSFKRHIGAWAWEDTSLFGSGETPVGWTHNSDWIALTLQVPSYVTLRLTNASGVPNIGDPTGFAGDNLFPGMSIYSGWDNDLAPQAFSDANNEGIPTNDWHSYVNRGNIEWAEDTLYFAHVEPNGTHVIEATFFMEAGNYSLVFGGNSPSLTPEPRQGYEATFTTSVVPEPGTALVSMLGGTALLARRGRRRLSR